jgi:sugar lactone lactonase YvrE
MRKWTNRWAVERATRYALAAAALAAVTACSQNTTGGATGGASSTVPSLDLASAASSSLRAAGEKPVLYVSDDKHDRVDAFRLSGGRIRRIASGLNYPQGLFVDAQGDLYVANRGANDVLEFKRGATAPSATFTDGQNQPEDVTVCPNGTVYVANILNASGGSGNIAVYAGGSHDPTGTITYGVGNFFFLACDASGNLFATLVYGTSGTVVEFPGGAQPGAKMLPISWGGNPGSIAADAAGNLLVNYGEGVQEFTEAGAPTGIKFATVPLVQLALNGANTLMAGASVGGATLYSFPSGTLVRSFHTGGTTIGVAIDSGG